MKLRIKGNSIRLRLLRSEVERFAEEGAVSETTELGSATFRYSLRASGESQEIRAVFNDGEIAVIIPESEALAWARGDGVGLEKDHGGLSIIVEKDFVCLDRPDDPDREDAYPNPSSECAS